MDRDLLGHLPVVIGVARHRGFAPAAAALGMSPSAVSHAVRTVEDRLGEPLFARTTRSVALTEAGTRFLASIEPALADIDKAAEGLAAERGEVTGLLRINTVRVALDMALTPILAKLARQRDSPSRSMPTTPWSTSWRGVSTPASGSASPWRRT
jgi:DNA-binding transcriptional LysR family regulator